MAKTYSFTEAVEVLVKGTDMEAILDIGKRYPAFCYKAMLVIAKAGNEFMELAKYIPENVTANKVNGAIKSTVSTEADEEPEDQDEPETEEVDEVPEAKVEEKPKAKRGRKSKAEKEAEAKAEAEKEAEDTEKEEAEETSKYDNMTEKELYKECKSRGLKAAPKKDKQFYVDLLNEDDKSKDEDDDDWDDGEDWDDEPEEEDEEEVKPEKKEKATKGTKAKKAEKKEPEPEEEDEDDDWEI